jgi:hypothetical protein
LGDRDAPLRLRKSEAWKPRDLGRQVSHRVDYEMSFSSLATSGNVADEARRKYIENQKPEDPDDHFNVV